MCVNEINSPLWGPHVCFSLIFIIITSFLTCSKWHNVAVCRSHNRCALHCFCKNGRPIFMFQNGKSLTLPSIEFSSLPPRHRAYLLLNSTPATQNVDFQKENRSWCHFVMFYHYLTSHTEQSAAIKTPWRNNKVGASYCLQIFYLT
jgi:hypothetical protein